MWHISHSTTNLAECGPTTDQAYYYVYCQVTLCKVFILGQKHKIALFLDTARSYTPTAEGSWKAHVVFHFPTPSKENSWKISISTLIKAFLHGGLTQSLLEFWVFLLRRPWRTAWIENPKARIRLEGSARILDIAVYIARHTRVQVQA